MEIIMDTQSELTGSKTIIAYLANQFPKCFTTEGEVKPLKIGIFQDIIDRLGDNIQLSKTKLRLALRVYTASWRYLYSVKEGASRIDLDGNVCEAVTNEQATHALELLKASKAKVKAQRETKNKEQLAPNSRTKKPAINKSGPKKAKSNVKRDATNNNRQSKPELKLNKAVAENLQVGNSVKVVLGSKPVSAIISNIEKEHIKVKVSSGMELTVTIEHIYM